MSGLVGFPSIWVSPPACLLGRYQLDLGFLAEDVISESFVGYSSNTLSSGFWPSQVVYISLGTSHKLNIFNCRSPI